ncbi:MAG TPA: hypothetical protein PK357_02625 [Candidatus Pacearchaeota archaeon]|nr:hypothetical protein [Candidatus Pacearchaeota archaeon]
MKNLLSKIFSKRERFKGEKSIKEIGEAPEIKLGQKFDIYIHVLTGNVSKKEILEVRGTKIYQHLLKEKNFSKGNFVMLDGIKGVFKIEGMYELGHSAQYRLELIRENLPKDYNKMIEKIESYSTNYQDDSFNIMP